MHPKHLGLYRNTANASVLGLSAWEASGDRMQDNTPNRGVFAFMFETLRIALQAEPEKYVYMFP